MSYKIKINDLKNAIYEAAMQRKSEYEGLKFVDRIFKENKDHIGKIKKIIKENKDNGKAVYDYLLNECGCSSKYDGVRDYMPTYEEEEILFDLEEDFDFPEEDYPTGETRYDYTIDRDSYSDEYAVQDRLGKVFNPEVDDVEETGFPGIEHEPPYEEDDDFIPEYWIAEQMFEGVSKKKKAHMKGMSEEEIMEQVQKMEEQGYSLTAFRNEAEMNEYLSEEEFTFTNDEAADFRKNYNDYTSGTGSLEDDFTTGLYQDDTPILDYLEELGADYIDLTGYVDEGKNRRYSEADRGEVEEELKKYFLKMNSIFNRVKIDSFYLNLFRKHYDELSRVAKREYVEKNRGQIEESMINKTYQTFWVKKSTNKIVNAYDMPKSDIDIDIDMAKDDLRGNNQTPSKYSLMSLKQLQRKGIDPFDPSNWVGYNPSKKKLNEYNDNLPPGISDQDIEDYMGDADDEYGEYPLISRLSDVYGDEFIKELLDELSDYESQYSSEQKLETELENYLKYNQFSTYDDTPFSEENMMKVNIVLNDISSMNENAGDESADSYYNTWSGAVEAAIKRAEKRGYYFTEEDNFPIINHHNQQRRKEETSSFSLPLYRKHEKIIISKIRRNEGEGIFFLNTNVNVSNAIKKMSRDIYESKPDAVILNDDKYLYNVLRPLLEGNEVDEVMLQLFKEEEKKLHIRIYDRDTDKGRFELVSYIS